MKIKSFVLVLLALLVITAYAPAQNYQQTPGEPEVDLSFYTPPADTAPLPLSPSTQVKNVILLIGDGMGIAHVEAASLKATGVSGRLDMERMPVTGLSNTNSTSNIVTDSAAGGTALSTGFRTNNYMIARDPDGKNLKTLAEAAREAGMSAGLAVTCGVTHATPASFSAHVENRKMEDVIAEQMVNNRIDVILGGGKEYFIPSTETGSKRKDEKNILNTARDLGYNIIETREDLIKAEKLPLLGIFSISALKTEAPEPTLAEMTDRAITLLSKNEKGFFLMVEGSQIDWAAHSNKADQAIRQTLLFDQAVKTALDFAAKDGKTLVLVTADHETGGMAIEEEKKELSFDWTSRDHTGTPVPVFACGPGAIKFTGVMNNTDIPKKIGEILGLKNFPQKAE